MSMKSYLTAVGAAALTLGMIACVPAGPSATAQTGAGPNKFSTVSVKPGSYSWKQKTEVVGFGSQEDNIECLIPEKATITLLDLAKDLEKGCDVDKVSQIQGGYSFQLVCSGKTKGTADAKVIATPTSLLITAVGQVTVGGFIPAGFSAKADAKYLGECSAADYAKEKERWAKEHPNG